MAHYDINRYLDQEKKELASKEKNHAFREHKPLPTPKIQLQNIQFYHNYWKKRKHISLQSYFVQ